MKLLSSGAPAHGDRDRRQKSDPGGSLGWWPVAGRLLTVGYGGRSVEELIEILTANDVEFLIDVRSSPFSRYRQEFARRPLATSLASRGLKYVFMGAELGGRPDDPDCYDPEGHVDYERCRERQLFQDAIDRLASGVRAGHHLALLCSESKPEDCHRAKLIAETLVLRDVEVEHIDDDGSVVSHATVMSRIDDPQMQLLGATSAVSRSRRSYR